jgi:uncharacterized Tic20 family protein
MEPTLENPPPAPQNSEQNTWAMLCHLASLSGYIIPFGNILGPLVVWLMKKDTMPLVDDQGKESMNFQITVAIAAIVCIPLIFVCVGIFLLIAVGIAALVFTVIAAIQASKGTAYRYPLALRLIK